MTACALPMVGFVTWVSVKTHKPPAVDWVGPWPEKPGLPAVLDGVAIGATLDEVRTRRPDLFTFDETSRTQRDEIQIAGTAVERSVSVADAEIEVELRTSQPSRRVVLDLEGPTRRLVRVRVKTTTTSFPGSWGEPTLVPVSPGAGVGPLWLDEPATTRFFRDAGYQIVQRYTPLEQILGDGVAAGIAGLRPAMSPADIEAALRRADTVRDGDGDLHVDLDRDEVSYLKVYGSGRDGVVGRVFTMIDYGAYDGHRDRVLAAVERRWGPPSEARPDGTLSLWQDGATYGSVEDDVVGRTLKIYVRSEPSRHTVPTREEAERAIAEASEWLGPFPATPGPPKRLRGLQLGAGRTEVRRALDRIWPTAKTSPHAAEDVKAPSRQKIEIDGRTFVFEPRLHTPMGRTTRWTTKEEPLTSLLVVQNRSSHRLDSFSVRFPSLSLTATMEKRWGPPLHRTSEGASVWLSSDGSFRVSLADDGNGTMAAFTPNLTLAQLVGKTPSAYPMGRPELIGLSKEKLEAEYVTHPSGSVYYSGFDPQLERLGAQKMRIQFGYCAHADRPCWGVIRIDDEDRVSSVKLVIPNADDAAREATWRELEALWGASEKISSAGFSEFVDENGAVLARSRPGSTMLFAPPEKHSMHIPLQMTKYLEQ